MASGEAMIIADGNENDSSIDKKKAKITKQLQRRDDERITELIQKKIEKESEAAQNESADFFQTNFTKEKAIIEEGLDKLESIDQSQISQYLDELLMGIQKLQKFLTESTIFLIPYDVQKAQDIINQLQAAVNTKRETLVPKKKFAFKSKKKVTEKNVKTETVHKEKVAEVRMAITECSFTDKENEILVKESKEINQKDVALVRLKDCTIKLFGSPLAIHINNLKNCRLFSGPVSGSVFMDNCVNCVIVVGCQQLRIHNTTNTDFYIHVTSKAIIEDCSDVRFAPYNLNYKELDEHYALAELNRSINNWSVIDDFNWLASDAHSPNWSVITEDKRTHIWDL